MLSLIPLKYWLYAAALAVLIWLGLTVNHWRIKARERDEAIQTLEQERTNFAATIQRRDQQDRISSDIGTKREDAISDLRAQLVDARNSIPRVSLRQCPSVRPPTGAASVPHGASEAGPDTADEADTDYGPALLDIAAEAASCGNQLTLLQAWLKAQQAL